MHEIGHVLGLFHSYDLSSNQGRFSPTDLGEEEFPGSYDIGHLLQLHPKLGSDIDLYRFDVPAGTSGIFTAETVVARPGEERLSELDTVLTLYRETTEGNSTIREMIARNDDTYSRDSLIDIRLDTTLDESDVTYYVAVTSTGNTDFNPELHDSGYGGRSEGSYQLNLSFKEDSLTADNSLGTILDKTGTALDGDQNGVAGGTFKYWFKTASPGKYSVR